MKHTNEADAKREHKIAIREQNEKYCPLIKGYCRMDCMNYYEGRKPHEVKSAPGVMNPMTPYWLFYSPSCDNPMVAGTMVVTVEA